LGAADLRAIAVALAVFSLGMFAWGAQNILARGFYAARDTLTPAITGTALTFLNLPVYWWLVHHYQYWGLALASSVGIIVYTVLLFILLNRRTKNREAAEMVWFFLKVTAASVIAAGVCFKLTQVLRVRIGWQTTLHALAVLVIASSVGFTVTALLAKLFRVRELDTYFTKLRL
jgi:putative peptidoglycan lipid II flippase